MFQRGRYPLNNMQCPVLKDALSRQIVTPVIACGDQVLAFRVVWRETDETALETAWDAVALQRRKCDAVVRAQPNLEFYASSITGVFTKSVAKGMKPRAIFPAVSYWMVTSPDGDDGDARAVMTWLHGIYVGAEIKPITSQRRQSSDATASTSAPLYVVLKDHSSGYVRRRVERSLHILGEVSEARAPSRFVVLPNSKYCNHIKSAIQTLMAAHLCADFIVADNS